MSILEKIKRRPENEKRVFSLVAAIILTLIIVFVWFSFGARDEVSEVAVKETKLSSISPIQVIKDEFSKAFSGFREDANAVLGTTTDEAADEVITEEASASSSAETSNN